MTDGFIAGGMSHSVKVGIDINKLRANLCAGQRC